MPQLDLYLKHMVASKASDLHLSSEEPIRLRIDGDLAAIDSTPIKHEQLEALLFEILSEQEVERFQKNKNLDRSYRVDGLGNFRFNVFLTRRGIAAVIRAIPSKIPTLSELGLPDIVKELSEADKGLVLVTGPTGSGKSTSLAAMIHHINSHFPYHILTVEDPIEFVHESQRSLINQREIGPSCHTFSDALKFALREDPDVILVGELRDLETMSLAMTAAETGHLVFATLHTRGAAASVDRLIDSFPANQQAMVRTMLSESLIAVISQALLKRAAGSGRVAAFEIMVSNHAISNLIREGKSYQIPSTMQTSRREGMILMEQHVRELIANGAVSGEEGESFLSSMGGGSGAGRGKGGGGGPAVPQRPQSRSRVAPSAPKPFTPEPLELTNHGVLLGGNPAQAAKSNSPAIRSVASGSRSAAPASQSTAPSSRAAALSTVGGELTASAKLRAPTQAKSTAPLPRPAAPPPIQATKAPTAARVVTAKTAATSIAAPPSTTKKTSGTAFMLLEEEDRPREKPKPPPRAEAKTAKPSPGGSETPEPTLLTDLTEEPLAENNLMSPDDPPDRLESDGDGDVSIDLPDSDFEDSSSSQPVEEPMAPLGSEDEEDMASVVKPNRKKVG